MAWSFKLVRLFGVDVKVHFTFLLLLLLLGMQAFSTAGMAGALAVVGRTLLVFACVVLHEYGHILTARQFGIQTKDVVLLPIGGVARLERLPERPREEFLIAIAGPAVNLAIAGLICGVLVSRGVAPPAVIRSTVPALLTGEAEGISLLLSSYWYFLLAINLFLMAFNLIPAYPMDGGRVLRALLSVRMGNVRATRVAAKVGQVLAMSAGVFGLVNQDFMLVLLAVFVYLGAGAEAQAVETRAAGKGIIVDQMMITKFDTIPVYATLRQAVDLLLDGEQREFPVVDGGGAVAGLLTRDNLIKGLAHRGADSAVSAAMTAGAPTLPLGLPFEEALNRLRASNLPALAVLDSTGRVVGLLTLDNITDLILVRQAVAKA
jgi:stage IV sporulation protein FB